MLALLLISIVVFGIIYTLTKRKNENPFKPAMDNAVAEDFATGFETMNKYQRLAFMKQSVGLCRKHSNKLRYSHNAKIKRRKK